MAKNRRHGKIEALPPALKESVNRRLDQGETYGAIARSLKERGYAIHLSSVARYAPGYTRKMEAVRLAREFARLLHEDGAERPATELHEANNALASQLIMETMVDDGLSPADKLKAVKAIAALQSAQAQTERLKIESRRAAGDLKTALSLIKRKIYDQIADKHPDIAEAIMAVTDEIGEPEPL